MSNKAYGNDRLNDKECSTRRDETIIKAFTIINIQTSLRLCCSDNIAILQLNRNNSLVSNEQLQSLEDPPSLIGIPLL